MGGSVTGELNSFFSQHKLQKFKKGEILIRADDDPPGIFYLTEGIVKMYCISNKGDEITLNIFKPDSFFPMTWAINTTPNNYYYEAVTEITARRAPKEDTVQFIKHNPDVFFDLLSRVYKGIDGLLQRMSYLMAGTAYSRLITEILLMIKRFGKNDSSRNSIIITEKDLASQTGMTRETVSREMAILKKKGLVTFNRKVLEVPDIKRLTDELSGAF